MGSLRIKSDGAAKKQKTLPPVERYYWCALCERVYTVHEWKLNGGRCPGEDCEAPVALRIGWENVRSAHPEYPETPERNEYYSMERYRL